MRLLPIALLLAFAPAFAAEGENPAAALRIENDCIIQSLAPDATTVTFTDRASGTNLVTPAPFAAITYGGKEIPATALVATPRSVKSGQTARLDLKFGASGVSAVLRLCVYPRYYTVEVASVSTDGIEQLVFCNLSTTLKGTPPDPLAMTSMVLNLKTKAADMPWPVRATRASCYPRFGMRGAKVALLACPFAELRKTMQEVVSASPDVPHSPLGGPWAMDAPIVSGSYLFNFGDMSEDKVDDWIKCAQSIGFNQIDFHGGSSFRFGDFLPNPVTYPKGNASLKAVIDKLHASGIKAGLHTYAFFIDKRCPYVTPKPDPRLAKDATFTLAAPLTETSDTVTVVESTEKMSPITGFQVRNSATVQIGDELITYKEVSKTPPYAFTGCKRGACGTTIATHAPGVRVQHLKECFGLFVPDPKTDMLAEIAANTAKIYNECGFDMIYLDALDGEDVLGGSQDGWHYGVEFVFEICKRLKKPALMEMSTFHPRLWYARSRLGAWDHPNRSHKRFIDIHCRGNESSQRMFLSSNLGWWALKTWSGAAGEPTFSDDIEYLCGKAVGTNSSLSLMGINPGNYNKPGAIEQLGPIFKQYLDLREAGGFSEAAKAKLAVPGDEFALLQEGQQWLLQPVQYAKHKVEGLDGWSDRWESDNRFGEQPVQLRLQALMAAGAYEAPASVTVLDLAAPGAITNRAAATGITAEVTPSTEQVKVGTVSAKLTAKSTLGTRTGSWAKLGRIASPPLNLSATHALGLWVYGDGQGEVLNVQIASPKHLQGLDDHYIIVDFTGWRYFELVEPEGERHANYKWPYGGIYSIYREFVSYGSVEEINVWVNNLPPGKEITCYLSPIRALPLVDVTLTNPAIAIGDHRITFPVAMTSGSYLEFRSAQDCKLYDPQGSLLSEVAPQGDAPVLPAGKGSIAFSCAPLPDRSTRANVWVISKGKAFPTR